MDSPFVKLGIYCLIHTVYVVFISKSKPENLFDCISG